MASGICDSVVCGWLLLYADVLDDSEALSDVLDDLEALHDDVIGGSVAALSTTNCAITRMTVAFIRLCTFMRKYGRVDNSRVSSCL